MDEPVPLPARFDGASVEAFTQALRERRARPLTIEAGAISHVGALGIQAQISARRQWLADGVEFRVEGVNDALYDICGVLGIDPCEIGAGDPGKEAQ